MTLFHKFYKFSLKPLGEYNIIINANQNVTFEYSRLEKGFAFIYRNIIILNNLDKYPRKIRMT